MSAPVVAPETTAVTTPKAGKISKMFSSFKVKSAPKTETEVPAYRFMVSCQGHGYPVPLTPATAPSSPATAAAAAKAGLFSGLMKREASAKKTAVPEYRFISTMAGYGCPIPTDATPLVKKTEKHALSFAAIPFVGAATAGAVAVAKKEVKQAEVPAHRFMVSCQGHGYPIPQSTCVPKAKKHNILSNLTSVFTKRAPVATAAPAAAAVAVAEEKKETETKVPEYRFITSMANGGYPIPESTVVPKPAKKQSKGIFAQLMGMFKPANKANTTVAAGQA